MEKLHVGVVVNPSKLKDVAEFRGRVVSHVFSVAPDAQVSFYETTVEDAGFVVIAGFGFDAVIMENTDSRLKKTVGWLAYVVAGAKKIVGRGQSVDLELDGRAAKPLKARTVMIGNVGRLPGGITLMPGADRSNGSLEILALDWKGAAGFSQILGQLVLPGAPRSLAKISNHRTFQAREAVVSTSTALPVQVDGDYVGNATHLVTRVDAGALLIRCARPARRRQSRAMSASRPATKLRASS